MTEPPTPTRVLRARRAAFIAWAALIVLEILWHACWQSPIDMPALALAVVPLLLPLLAWRRPHRALLWAGIFAVFYFIHGVSTAWTTPAARIPSLLEVVLSVILIGALGAATQKRARTVEIDR
ncbi:MAG TPA: DUF2069 domain-containing protein [Rhodanobacteraceae bacterium]